MQDETPYNLLVTSTDRAGNAQRSRFQFFIPSERRVTDDDTLPNQPLHPSDPDPKPDPVPDQVVTWDHVGPGGAWGSYSSSGGGGGGGGGTFTSTPGAGFDPADPTLKDSQKGLEGYGYEYTYTESIERLVEQAVDFISTDPATLTKKAALYNRASVLQGLGAQVEHHIQADGDFTNDQALIDRLRSALEGLFADAYDPEGNTAGVRPSFVPWGGAWLAQALVSDPRSVREQVFQATLLTVVTEATPLVTNVAQQQALATAVMALAKTYAWLNPNPEATVPTADQDFGFLDALWRLQIPDANGQFKDGDAIAQTLSDSVAALKRLLVGVEDPVRAIQFLNNLVQAASNVTSLKGDVKDATFLRELVEFGVEFVQTNPTANPSATDTAVQGFLDRLWRGDIQQVKQAQGGLNAFFAGMETAAERLKGLKLAENLLEAAALLQDPELRTQKDDPTFLDMLLGLGGSYAAVDAMSFSVLKVMSQEDPSNFFLNTLGNAQDSEDIQLGSEQLEQFLKDYVLWQGEGDVTEPDGTKTKGLLDLNQFSKAVEQLTKEIEKTLLEAKQYGRTDGLRSIQAQLDRIEKSYIPHSNLEGSGKHGSRFWMMNSDDLFLYSLLNASATYADVVEGLKNAAKHMRHYLGNSGKFLTIDAKNLSQSSQEVRDNIADIKQDLLEKARSLPQDVDYPPIEGDWRPGSVVSSDSALPALR